MNRWLYMLCALVLALTRVAPVDAAPTRQGTPGRGAVYTLRGTPHLWIADDEGVLHWSGDTRALSGRYVNWGNRVEVGLDQLRALRRGDPWLSAGLLKLADPIYFVKWETDQPRPTLLHIQSIADVELFGINAQNYGRFVLERQAWEQQFNLSSAGLPRGVLAAAVAPAATRERPVPLGTAVDLPEGWQFTVLSATPNATDLVRAHNRFNPLPQPGHQFFLVRVSVKRTGAAAASFPAGVQLRLVGSANVAYKTFEHPCGTIPEALSSTELFPGGTITGNLCWQVPSAEAGSLVLYHENPFSQANTFFALR
jgi:hypothetical protein